MTAIGQQNPILLFLATTCHRCCSASCAAGITRGSPLSCSCYCVCCWSIRNEAEGEQLERARNCKYKNINSLGDQYTPRHSHILYLYLSKQLTDVKGIFRKFKAAQSESYFAVAAKKKDFSHVIKIRNV